jgi:hypothetical protein
VRAPIRALLLTLVSLALVGSRVAAQHGQTVVQVRVVDTAGAPVANVDVAILHGLNTVAASGTTDDAGMRALTIPRGGGDFQIVVRRIGFQRSDQFFRADRDSVALRMILRRATQQLPTVNVTADQDLKRKHYHVDADEIAASTRPIIDGLDILTKLRPDIIYSRVPSGADACGLFYIWVNGRRIVYPPINDALAVRAAQARRGAKATPHIGGRGLVGVPLDVQSVLSTIHPEHIAEINYADCNDFSVDKTNARNAVFVTLKPGIGFEPGTGSFVADLPGRATDLLAPAKNATWEATPTGPAPFRTRILGVFDETTGDPIPDVEVADSASGTFARTTITGTVSLVFLPVGTSTVLVHKLGYTDVKLEVSISPRDSIPITLTMAKPK